MRNIVFKTFGVINQLQEALVPLANKITVAFVYGSFARSEEISTSDFDLFLVGRLRLGEIVNVLSKVEKAIKREINPTLFSETEFKHKWLQKNHFLRSLSKVEKEFVIGTKGEFKRLVE